ncbi:MAG TPA: potassium transporter TrkG [Thermomicrobiales bacterium]|nr:potassium transporter TrkG [Thermomicrobiales bacterium]
MSVPPARRPGDRIVRRRVRPTQVIELPEAPPSPGVPSVRQHSKLFALGLLGIVLVASILLSLPIATRDGEATPFVDALFTSVSAVCVVGLVTVDTATHWNAFGQVIILLLIQAGGLGFMVGASIVLRFLQRDASGLRESLMMRDGAPTLSLREAAELSRRITIFTFSVEGIGALILSLRFSQDMPFPRAVWHGVFHSVSGFCNAGFDLQGQFQSLQRYETSIVVNLTLIVLVFAGSLSFLFFADIAASKRWRSLALETKLIVTMSVAIALAGTAVFLGAEWNGALSETPVWARPMVGLFQATAARTAGFSTIEFGGLNNFTLFVWILGMFIGGASASTAGGAKLQTVGVVAVAVMSTLRGQTEPQIYGRRIPTQLVFRAMAVIFILLVAHFAITLLLAVTEHFSPAATPSFINLFFEAMSAVAVVGLSTGITSELTTPGKLLLSAAMIFGRLGPLTVAYALQRRQHIVRYRFPETAVRIG